MVCPATCVVCSVCAAAGNGGRSKLLSAGLVGAGLGESAANTAGAWQAATSKPTAMAALRNLRKIFPQYETNLPKPSANERAATVQEGMVAVAVRQSSERRSVHEVRATGFKGSWHPPA